MKVINITEEGRFGGPQKRILEVARACKGYDIHTLVILPNSNAEKFEERLINENIDFIKIKLHRLTKSTRLLIRYLFSFPFEILHLIRILKREKPDAVHCNGSWQIKGVIAAKIAGIRSVWHMNDTHFRGLVMRIFKFVSKRFADQFVAASYRSLHHYLPGYAIPPDQIIQAPIDTTTFDPEIVKPADDLDRQSNGINILTVGHINKVKGYHTLIPAIEIVNKYLDKEEKVNFFVVGRFLENLKSYTKEILDLVKEKQIQNLAFLGERNDIKELLRAADIYVCPSDYESSPISVWEAMAMARPIVSTDVGDVRDIFGRRNSGIVVPKGDPVKLAEGILKLIRDETLRSGLGDKARKTAVEELDLKVCVEKHVKLYRKMAGAINKNGAPESYS